MKYYKVSEASMEELLSKLPALMRSKFKEVKYDEKEDYHYILLRLVVEEARESKGMSAPIEQMPEDIQKMKKLGK